MTGLVDQHVRGLDVLVDKAALVGVLKSFRQTDGDAKETGQIGRSSVLLLDNPIQRFTTRIFKDQDDSTLLPGQRQWPRCPRDIQLCRQGVLVREPTEVFRRLLFIRDCYREDGRLACALDAAVMDKTRSFAKRLQYIIRFLRH